MDHAGNGAVIQTTNTFPAYISRVLCATQSLNYGWFFFHVFLVY